MLKFIYLKNQKVPVPVPILDLKSAIEWAQETFCQNDQIITRVTLDEDDVNLDLISEYGKLELTSDNVLAIQVDAAKDLSMQTLEAVKDFASVVIPRVKQVAVDLYKGPKESMIVEFDEMMTDLDFIFDLRFHVNGILDQYHEAMAPFEGLSYLAEIVKKDLIVLRQQQKWEEAAVSILGRLEPFLAKLIQEIDELQIKVSNDESILIANM